MIFPHLLQLRAQPTRDVEILRVNQLDAMRLDEELYELLKAQLLRALSCFQVNTGYPSFPRLNP